MMTMITLEMKAVEIYRKKQKVDVAQGHREDELKEREKKNKNENKNQKERGEDN